MTMTPETVMQVYRQIVGEQLSSVTFVMDYLQLAFNPPPSMSIYTPLTVCCSGHEFARGDDQFRNRLCEQITKIVKSVEFRKEEAFLITFQDDSSISISLKPSDYTGPEALDFLGRNGQWIII